MFLSTMQTLPDQIRLGPAEMISLLSFSVEGFILVEYVQGCFEQRNNVCEYEVNR